MSLRPNNRYGKLAMTMTFGIRQVWRRSSLPLVSTLHMVNQTLCKRTAPSSSLHLTNAPPANLVFEKCSGSVEHYRETKAKTNYWFNRKKIYIFNSLPFLGSIQTPSVSLFLGCTRFKELNRPCTWHTADKEPERGKTPPLWWLFMITRRCQGLFVHTPITSSLRPQCQLHPLGNDACQSTQQGQKSHARVYRTGPASGSADVIYTKV